MVYKWLNNIQNRFIPYFCALCGERAQAHIALCETCYNQLNYLENNCIQCAQPIIGSSEFRVCGQCIRQPPYFDQAISLFAYNTPVQQLIARLKFQKKLNLARLFGTLLSQRIQTLQNGGLPDCIVPVPLSNQRLRERSYNQAVEIARPISSALNIPMDHSLLKRIRHAPPQSSLDLKMRHKNVRNAFSVTRQNLPDHIAIIDDVVTTGATCNELARLLKKAGVRKVVIWSIARATRDT